MRGVVESGLLRQGLRYALGLRLVVVALSSFVSLLLVDAPNQAATAAIVIALNAWNIGYAYALLAGRRWPVLVDVAVMCGVCLTQLWTVRSDPRGGAPWVLIAVAITIVTYPWQIGWPAFAAATVVILTAHYLGTLLVDDPGGWIVSEVVELWTAAEGALSWALYRFVRRSARRADRIVERGEQLRSAAAVAAARRVDEREYLAALHDTASATLLMVGNGVVARPEPWLARQARRDLHEIRRSDVAAGGEVDLIGLLREVAAHTPLRVSWDAPDALLMPAVDAISLSRGAREALTNVLRHAEIEQAGVRVRGDAEVVTVEITDAGRGFDTGRLAEHRYGVTGSLIERMARTGGRARIMSSPGAGTTVTMTVPVGVAELPGDDAEVITTSFQRGLRWAVVVMSLAILVFLNLPRLLASAEAYKALWPQFAAWGGLLAVTLVAAVATWRDRPLGRWRWPLLAVVLACSVLAATSVRPGYLLGPAHWSEGDAGWPVVLLMLESRVAVFAVVLAAQYLVTFALAALAGQAALSLAGVVSATWAVLAFQVAVAMIAAVLRGLAASSAKVLRADERLRTSEEVARHLHQDRSRRYADLAVTTVPLLEGLASAGLDPGDESVRRSCAAEAARMRRLLDDDAALADSLSHELRACIELAERNGVAVSFAEYGARPELSAPVRRRLTEPAIAALAVARGNVRLTVAGTGDAVTVSVIAQCPPLAPMPDLDGVRRSMMPDGDRWWLQAAWHGGS